MRILFLLLFSLLISSCNQNMIGGIYATKNLITKPFSLVGNAITNHMYNNVEKRDKSKLDLSNECWVKTKPMSGELSDLEKIQEALRGDVCSCVPWGTCSTNECPCKRLCPNNFDIFKRPEVKEMRDHSYQENSLGFRNAYTPSQFEVTQGYCWGHASVTSKFNRLAFFKKDIKPPHSLDSSNEDEQVKAVRYYKRLIDKIVKNEAVDIPGFKNLEELSKHEQLQGYIADHVATSWGQRAMTTQGLGVAISDKKMSEKDSDQFLADAKKKIDQNQQPQIVFTARGRKLVTHAVLVSDYITKKNGDTVLCVRDNNNYRPTQDPNRKGDGFALNFSQTDPEIPSWCSEHIIKKPDGGLFYSKWSDLGRVEIASNENPDSLIQFNSLIKKCNKDKGCDN